MPAKSKHGRGKHPHRNKVRQHPQGAVAGQPVQPGTSMQATAKPTAAPAARSGSSTAQKAAANAAAIASLDQSFVLRELKFIGILTGITVVIMIILAVIFK